MKFIFINALPTIALRNIAIMTGNKAEHSFKIWDIQLRYSCAFGDLDDERKTISWPDTYIKNAIYGYIDLNAFLYVWWVELA